MADETVSSETVKSTSDGFVKVSLEKYTELVDTVADQKDRISRLNDSLRQARNEPPVINRTVVQKTPELAAREYRVWGSTCMGLGGSLFVIGALLYRAGLAKS